MSAVATIGHLRERVTVQQKSTGAGAVTWSTLATVWALVSPQSAGESQQTEAVRSLVSYWVEVMWRTDITPSMRLSWTPYGGSAKTLQINGVRMKPGQNQRLLLDCTEVA